LDAHALGRFKDSRLRRDRRLFGECVGRPNSQCEERRNFQNGIHGRLLEANSMICLAIGYWSRVWLRAAWHKVGQVGPADLCTR
jgi:hypothetical protein